jgi:hypothetical protein
LIGNGKIKNSELSINKHSQNIVMFLISSLGEGMEWKKINTSITKETIQIEYYEENTYEVRNIKLRFLCKQDS